MRKSRMRVLTAGVLGAALLTVASPAWAADTPTATPTPCTSPSPTATATESAPAAISVPFSPTSPSATAAAVPATTAAATSATATATDFCVAAGIGTATATPVAIPDLPAGPTPTTSSTPGVINIPGIGPINVNIKQDCEIFNSFSPVKLPCDTQITGLDSFVPNPLIIKATCGPDGPDWTITNTGTKELGYGWFDINLGGGVALIAPGETQTLKSHSIAVIASPWDAATSTLLVTIPAVGYSTCPGAKGLPTAVPAVLPTAVPATAVVGTPHFTG